MNNVRTGYWVSLQGHHLQAEEGALDILGRMVATTTSPTHGYSVHRVERSLVHSPGGRWNANAGCLPLLQHVAAKEGCELSLSVHEPGITRLFEPPEPQNLQYPSLAGFAMSCQRGLIRVSSGVSEAAMIAEFARAFPAARVVVLGSRVQQLEGTLSRLEKELADEVALNQVDLVHDGQPLKDGIDDEAVPRITLATYLGAGGIDFATSDIVLLLDAADCIKDPAERALEQVDAQFRLFGMLRSGRTQAPAVRDRMMSVFGPALLDVMSGGRVRRNVAVDWINNRQDGNKLTPRDSAFNYKCYVHNSRRNRRIAQLARKYYESASEPTVTVLVEQLDHAIALGKVLKDWPIHSSNDVDTYGKPGRVRTRLKNDRKHSPGRRQIVLADVARQFPGYETDIVITASSGPHVAALPESWLYQLDWQPRPLRIVDFRDRFNPQTKRWSRNRQRAYERRDLFEMGLKPVEGRIRCFLQENSDSRQGAHA